VIRARLHASAVVYLMHLLFWDVMQHRPTASFKWFGIAYWFHLDKSSRSIGCKNIGKKVPSYKM